VLDALGAQVIDQARNRGVLTKAGAIIIPMDSLFCDWRSCLKDADFGWQVENQPGKLSALTLGSVTLQARTLTALSSASVELLAGVGAKKIVRRSYGDGQIRLTLQAEDGQGGGPGHFCLREI
jgi:hypothetical protein